MIRDAEQLATQEGDFIPAAWPRSEGVFPRIIRKPVTPTHKQKVLKHTRRAHARTYTQTEIVFREEGSAFSHKGIMRNHSPGGIYFESFRALAPNSLVRIKIREESKAHDLTMPVVCRAEVIWCRALSPDLSPDISPDLFPDLSPDGRRRYGVGLALRSPFLQ